MNEGWIKIHRKILESSVWTTKDCYLFQLWIYILLSVNHEDREIIFNGKPMTIKAGQGIFGLNQIVKDCTKLHDENKAIFKKYKTIYYRRLKILQNIENVKLQPNNKFTVISVINWDKYQASETQLKLQRNSSETPVLTNNNVKNGKNIVSPVTQPPPNIPTAEETSFNEVKEKETPPKEKEREYANTVNTVNKVDKVINDILSLYKEKINKFSRLTPTSKIKISLRLKTFTYEEIAEAITNFSERDWWMENNGWRGLAWFFHSDDRIDQFINIKRNKKEERIIKL